MELVEGMRVELLLLEPPAATQVDAGEDVAGRIRLDRHGHRVAAAGVEEVLERLDAVVERPVEPDDAAEVALLGPELGAAGELVRKERRDLGRVERSPRALADAEAFRQVVGEDAPVVAEAA